ncbi:MAG: L-rhamnose isomerase, partial [Clostridia bacterium]|nr:L-rhamnose isomerase [Clostridia bacterium]
MNTRYEYARADYASRGIDTEAALAALATKSISMHCWQGDDLRGFDGDDEINGGGIQATGNYPGAARTPAELMADIDRALSL